MRRLLLSLALLAGPARAGEMVLFHEDCTSATVALNSSTSILIGTAWSAKVNVVGSPSATLRSEPTMCGPSVTATTVGLVYTATPVPTTDVYWAEFTWLDSGTVVGTDSTGLVVNFIDSNNYYACTISDDEPLNTIYRIVKVRTGSGTLAGSASGVPPTGAVMRCKIDYTVSPPIITFTDETNATTWVTFTDTGSPLTKTPRAGVMAGANQLNNANGISENLDWNDFKVTELRPTRGAVTVQ